MVNHSNSKLPPYVVLDGTVVKVNDVELPGGLHVVTLDQVTVTLVDGTTALVDVTTALVDVTVETQDVFPLDNLILYVSTAKPGRQPTLALTVENHGQRVIRSRSNSLATDVNLVDAVGRVNAQLTGF